ncbi:hypothetical protein ACKKBG_A24350 [Auxenochlorella protothecoides x Auxenochlorella symbiontica]
MSVGDTAEDWEVLTGVDDSEAGTEPPRSPGPSLLDLGEDGPQEALPRLCPPLSPDQGLLVEVVTPQGWEGDVKVAADPADLAQKDLAASFVQVTTPPCAAQAPRSGATPDAFEARDKCKRGEDDAELTDRPLRVLRAEEVASLHASIDRAEKRALATEKQLASARDRLRRRDLQLQCESFDAWRLRRVALLAFSTLAFLGLRSVLTHEAVVRTSIVPRQPTRAMDTLF